MPISPHYKRLLEGHALTLRNKVNAGYFGRLDPFLLADKMGMDVHFVGPDSGLPEDLLERALGQSGSKWDAGTIKFPDGRIRVFMNPKKLKERQHATLMEEVSHIHLGHKPTEIVQCEGIAFRTCNKSHESQAYWLGATALLPERLLKGSITRGLTMEEVAGEHQVSIDLVRFRCNVLGLKIGLAA